MSEAIADNLSFFPELMEGTGAQHDTAFDNNLFLA